MFLRSKIVYVTASYNSRFQEIKRQEHPDFRHCTRPTCGSGQIVSSKTAFDTIRRCFVKSTSFYSCKKCGYHSCANCCVPAHVGLTCKQYQIQARHAAEEVASQGWLNKHTRRCYSCRRICYKETGCDHVTCICRAEWCWLCIAPFDDIRRHGNHFHRENCRHYA